MTRTCGLIATAVIVASWGWPPPAFAPPPLPTPPPAEEPDDAPGLRLDPHYETGQRWTLEYDVRWDVTTAETNGTEYPANLVMGLRGGQAIWVLEAADGEYLTAVFEFDRCVKYTGTREQPKPAEEALPYSGKQCVLLRELSPITGKVRHRVLPEIEGLLEAIPPGLRMEMLPDEPVEVGDAWQTKELAGLFGPTVSGRMRLKLARELVGGDRRPKAVLAVTDGEATAATGQGSTVTTTFEGNIRVDLQSRLIDRVELSGASSLETTAGTFTSRQSGPWKMTQRSELLETKVPTPEKVAELIETVTGMPATANPPPADG